jgi:hypothetical protein
MIKATVEAAAIGAAMRVKTASAAEIAATAIEPGIDNLVDAWGLDWANNRLRERRRSLEGRQRAGHRNTVKYFPKFHLALPAGPRLARQREEPASAPDWRLAGAVIVNFSRK